MELREISVQHIANEGANLYHVQQKKDRDCYIEISIAGLGEGHTYRFAMNCIQRHILGRNSSHLFNQQPLQKCLPFEEATVEHLKTHFNTE